jgi:hypothetical protein
MMPKRRPRGLRRFIGFAPWSAALLFAACLRLAAAEEEGLVIVDAVWRSSTRESNVTSTIRARVHDDSLEFPARVDALGEPHKGHQKILRVIYRYHGVENTIEVVECTARQRSLMRGALMA